MIGTSHALSFVIPVGPLGCERAATGQGDKREAFEKTNLR